MQISRIKNLTLKARNNTRFAEYLRDNPKYEPENQALLASQSDQMAEKITNFIKEREEKYQKQSAVELYLKQ